MSYSTHRRQSLDSSIPLGHRISHVRSCAVHMAQKYGVRRSVILERIGIMDGYEEGAYPTSAEIEATIGKLDEIKKNGIGNV
jgi:hypothetical protein